MHVIVVEDDLRIRDFLSRGLAAEGYQVRSSAKGRQPYCTLSSAPGSLIGSR